MSDLRIAEATARLMAAISAANARAEKAEAAVAAIGQRAVDIARQQADELSSGGGYDRLYILQSPGKCTAAIRASSRVANLIEHANASNPNPGQPLLDRLAKAESERAELVVRQGASDAGFSAARTGQPNDPPPDMGNEEDWSLGWCAGNWRAKEAELEAAAQAEKAWRRAGEKACEMLQVERNRMVVTGGDAVVSERMRADRAEAERDRLAGENARLREALRDAASDSARLQADTYDYVYEIGRLREALTHYATCSDGCTCGDGWSHDVAVRALFSAPPIGKIDIHLDAVTGKGIPQTGDER